MIKRYDRQKDVVMTRRQVRDFDAWAINKVGISGVVLMENAGRGCTEVIIQKLVELGGTGVCVLCGIGNNGGDGFVIARHLYNAGFNVVVLICGDSAKIKGDAEINYNLAKMLKIRIENINPASEQVGAELTALASGCDLVVDAIFGTGLAGSLRDGYQNLITAVNSLGKGVIAVDIPSGLDCDNGRPLPIAVKAIATVTFAAAKKAFACRDSYQYMGDVYIASIGIEPSAQR